MFKYGYKGAAARQMASLAARSLMATQTIYTSQTTILGWNGNKFTKSESETVYMVHRLL